MAGGTWQPPLSSLRAIFTLDSQELFGAGRPAEYVRQGAGEPFSGLPLIPFGGKMGNTGRKAVQLLCVGGWCVGSQRSEGGVLKLGLDRFTSWYWVEQ